jgi:tetratricopeptide (TPR) repeat protein
VREHLGLFTHAELHRRAADLLAREGERDRAAVHLLDAAPAADPRVVALLREAAAGAAGRGDAGAARRLLQRALDEPPEAADRAELLVALVHAETAVGDTAALAHLDEAVASVPAFVAEIGALLDAARAGAVPVDTELQAIMALRLMSTFGDPALATRLAAAAVAGEIRENDDGLGLGFGYSLTALIDAGELRRAQAAATDALEWARERGSLMGAAIAALWRGQARLQLGDLDGADADAEAALWPWRAGWNWNAPQAFALRARVALERGEHEAASDAIAEGAAILVPHPPHLYATGLVRLAGGDAGGALDAFRRAGHLLETLWGVETPAVLPWRSGAAVAALGSGLPDEAATLADVEVDRARRAGVPSVLGVALRARGLVAGGEAGVELLRGARRSEQHRGCARDRADARRARRGAAANRRARRGPRRAGRGARRRRAARAPGAGRARR